MVHVLGCKFGKGGNKPGIKKFKLVKDATLEAEKQVEKTLNSLATKASSLLGNESQKQAKMLNQRKNKKLPQVKWES